MGEIKDGPVHMRRPAEGNDRNVHMDQNTYRDDHGLIDIDDYNGDDF